MTGWRLVVRLARREVWRRPGRTALVALLVALPVACMAIAITVIRTDQPTLADEWARHNGTAEARAFNEEELELLPEGSVTAPMHVWYVELRAVDGPRRAVQLYDLDGLEPFAPVGPVLVEGRAPRATGEITLDRSTARRLGVAVGEELAIDRPSPATLTLVGLAEDPSCLSCRVGHASLETLDAITPGPSDTAPQRWLVDLPPLALEDQVALFDASFGTVLTRDLHLRGWDSQVSAGSSDDGVRWSYVLGAVVLTVVGIVISAAFAVGARRQLVTIGQLSASGASPSTVRASLVLQGTLTGLAGAAFGLLLAAVVLLGAQGLIERHVLDERIDAYDVRALEVLGAALVGVLAATVAALIPARTAARVPTLAALAGRRPLPPVPRRLIGWGMASVAAGLALLGIAVVGARSGSSGQLWAFVAVVGGVAELLGACAIAPAVVARLEPLAARLRGSWRMAARGLARHRTRTGAVVGAVCAAAGLAIFASAIVQGAEAREPTSLDPSPRAVVVAMRESIEVPAPDGVSFDDRSAPPDAAVLARFQRALPDADTVVLREARTPLGEGGVRSWWDVPAGEDGRVSDFAGSARGRFAGGAVYSSYPGLLVADPEVLDVLELSDPQRAHLEEAGAVLLVRHGGGRETMAVQWDEASGSAPARRLPLVTVAVDHAIGSPASGILVTEAMAEDLGFEIVPMAALLVNDTALTQRERDLVSDVGVEVNQDVSAIEPASTTVAPPPEGELTEERVDHRWLEVSMRYPTSGPTPFQVELALTGLALVFSLFVVGTSLALAAAESKDERDVLTVAGAPPRLLARMAGARAWLLAGLGGAMAVPVGFLPVIVFSRAMSTDELDPFPLVFPLRTVVLLVLVVPAFVALVARAVSAIAQRARPVRVSTAVFE